MTSRQKRPGRAVRAAGDEGPLVVRVGILTMDEWTELTAADRLEIEQEAVRLLDRYGVQWFDRERERLRAELSFVYGAPNVPGKGL